MSVDLLCFIAFMRKNSSEKCAFYIDLQWSYWRVIWGQVHRKQPRWHQNLWQSYQRFFFFSRTYSSLEMSSIITKNLQSYQVFFRGTKSLSIVSENLNFKMNISRPNIFEDLIPRKCFSQQNIVLLLITILWGNCFSKMLIYLWGLWFA